jgi:hypothetical protein
MTHRSHALNWLNPRDSKREGWWRSPDAVQTVKKYEEVQMHALWSTRVYYSPT